MTLSSVSDIETIAKEWQEDDLLRGYPPTHISGLTPNFSKGVAEEEWEELRSVYLHLIDVYQQHPNWVVLQTFFDEMIAIWKNRPIFKVDGETPMSTCMPVNTKLYIDSRMQIAVCEKINDQFRIGTFDPGIAHNALWSAFVVNALPPWLTLTTNGMSFATMNGFLIVSDCSSFVKWQSEGCLRLRSFQNSVQSVVS